MRKQSKARVIFELSTIKNLMHLQTKEEESTIYKAGLLLLSDDVFIDSCTFKNSSIFFLSSNTNLIAAIERLTLMYLFSSSIGSGLVFLLALARLVSKRLRSLYNTYHNLCKSSKLCLNNKEHHIREREKRKPSTSLPFCANQQLSIHDL